MHIHSYPSIQPTRQPTARFIIRARWSFVASSQVIESLVSNLYHICALMAYIFHIMFVSARHADASDLFKRSEKPSVLVQDGTGNLRWYLVSGVSWVWVSLVSNVSSDQFEGLRFKFQTRRREPDSPIDFFGKINPLIRRLPARN